jgi:hypothetical protein
MNKIQPLLQSLYGVESPYRWWCFALTLLLILSFFKGTKPKAVPAFWILLAVMAVVFGGQYVMKTNAPVDMNDSETGRAAKRSESSHYHSRFSN